jgi:hypothetical protein
MQSSKKTFGHLTNLLDGVFSKFALKRKKEKKEKKKIKEKVSGDKRIQEKKRKGEKSPIDNRQDSE